MKSKVSLLTIIVMLTGSAFAQNARLNIYGAYAFEDNVDSYYATDSYYKGKINGGFLWGGGLEYMVKPNQGIELLYLRQDTKAPMTYFSGGVKMTEFDLGINYIMLAGNRYFRKPGGKAEGFTGLMLGADIVSLKNPDNNKSGTKTKFAWGIKGGVNIWATEKVGIKLQAQLLSAVQSVGGGLYFGTGGISTGLSSYSSMYQFSLGGGLVFNLGTTKK